MDRHKTGHLIGLLALGILARAVLFNHVGIWGDFGFYVYDARLINEGSTLFVDVIGRSPAFNYTFAWVVATVGHPVPLLRAFISGFWILTALPVYGIARHIRGHRSGLAAASLVLLSPFGLVYGMWANTQSMMAFLATSAVYIAVTREGWSWYTLIGVLMGLAFLSRRSVITVVLGLGLWCVYRLTQSSENPVDALHREVTNVLGVGVGFVAALFAVYAWMAKADPSLTYRLFETHAVGLITSSGRGGFPLVTEASPPVTNSVDQGRIPIFNDLCQLCGAWTARTFAKTTLVTIPLVGPLFYYGRDWSDRYFETVHRHYLGGILGLLTLYALASILLAGYYTRVTTILSLVLFAALAFRYSRIDRSLLYDRAMVLQLLILFGLAAGYLYRNRMIHTYYFMDFVPYLSIVSGVLYTRAWEVLGDE